MQSPPSNCVSASVKNVENLTDENVLVEENLQLAMSPAKVEPLNNATAAEKHSEVIPEGETDGHKCLGKSINIFILFYIGLFHFIVIFRSTR